MKQDKAQSSGKRDMLYTLEGNPGVRLVLPFSIQHILTMFVANMVPIGIIAASASSALTDAEIFNLIQSAMIAAGIATFIQVTPIGILGSGVEMIAEAGFTTHNKLITAISLPVAIGFTASTEADIWSHFPVAIQSIFSQNVVAVIFITALVLNLILPKSMD